MDIYFQKMRERYSMLTGNTVVNVFGRWNLLLFSSKIYILKNGKDQLFFSKNETVTNQLYVIKYYIFWRDYKYLYIIKW